MSATELEPARTPRRWIAAIGGWSPHTGIISLNPKAYDRFPESTERVWVREELPGEAAPVPAAAVELAADWMPTAENVNALPEPLRRYIHDLATRCHPAGEVATNAMLRDHIRMVEADNERLRAAQAEKAEAIDMADVYGAIEEAFTELARELGCFHCTDIPSNAGLFVPGQAKAQPNARAALVALFAHVREGGLVHRPLSADALKALGLEKAKAPAPETDKPARAPKAAPEPAQAEPQAEQIGLF